MKLNQLTLKQAQDGLRDGSFSSVELVTACLDEIERTDKELHAYMTVDTKGALASAKSADSAGYGDDSAPLRGIPIAAKDNYLTKGVRTTASSKVLDSFIPAFDVVGSA